MSRARQVSKLIGASNTAVISTPATFSNTVAVAASGITFGDSTIQTTAPSGFGFKNRIINGNMAIDQRNNGAQISNVSGGIYTVDRWNFTGIQPAKFNIKQNLNAVTPPTGFSNYLGLQVSSAVTIGAADYFFLGQAIEGFNTADLDFGKATAKPVTISFWVYSSLTGAFGGSLQSNASARAYAFNYTINQANTWEQKFINIVGDITGTWVGATNGIGMNLYFGLGIGSNYTGAANTWSGSNTIVPTGSVSIVGTSGATFYITGVQLEKGSTATSFDYRPYGKELALCQRYYWQSSGANYSMQMSHNSSARVRGVIIAPVPFRSSPTVAISGTPAFYNYNGGAITYSSITVANGAANQTQILVDLAISGTASGAYDFLGVLTANAEL